ncbi:hypothetical protein ACTQ49_10060 [Luteococcus sp. Sow4_B9]|uniref:hypothetical protein n=1 Tax=Luteococcus sp. Sow4_B9 TaxID=3438792 RepID=UPI003F982FB1
MANLEWVATSAMQIPGAVGGALVDLASGMCLVTAGDPGFSLEVAAAGAANVVQAKLRTMRDLEVDEEIDDILVTIGQQYHLMKVLHKDETEGLFAFLVLDRRTGNLALARHKMKALVDKITI